MLSYLILLFLLPLLIGLLVVGSLIGLLFVLLIGLLPHIFWGLLPLLFYESLFLLYYVYYLPFIHTQSKWNLRFIPYKIPYKIHQQNNYKFPHPRFFSITTKEFGPSLHSNSHKVYENKYNWNTWFSLNYYECINIPILKTELKYFFTYYKKNFNEHPYFAIIFKIKFPGGDVRSCSSVQVSNLRDFNQILEIFSHIFLLENFADVVSEQDNNSFDDYGNPKGNIIFGFKPMKNYVGTKYEKMYHPSTDLNIKKIFQEGKDYNNYMKYEGFKIPATMNLQEWPNIIFFDDNQNARSYIVFKDKNGKNVKMYYTINIQKTYHYVNLWKERLFKNPIFSFKDYMIDSKNLTNFKRTIFVKGDEKETYHFNNGEVVLFMKMKENVKFIPKLELPKPIKNFDSLIKILTLDIETKDFGNNKIPVCMSIYDGSKTKNFIFKDHNSWMDEMAKALKTIFIREYDSYNVYVHNLSYFDMIFIIDSLSILGKVKPLMRDDRVLKLDIAFETGKRKKKCHIKFLDSFLLLPSSLKDLSKSFNIQHKKSIFPLLFLNEEHVSLDYIGTVPEYKYFPGSYTDKFIMNEYNEYCRLYKNKEWNLKKELISYCEIDTIALYEIVVKFRSKIYSMFKLDITKYTTIPSFAFANYRTNYMPADTIPRILGKIHYTLKQALTGGISDVYKGIGWNVNSYDVISLYPSRMKYMPMPVGIPKYFSGNIFLENKNPFGFFKVNVKAPLDKYIGLIPVKILTENGWRTISPVGNFTSWCFSEEIKFAMKHGYEFEILEGYLFEKGYIFSDYVDKQFEIKSSVAKEDPMYYISKLLLNSLFGRFGLNPITEEVLIVSSEESEKIIMDKTNVKITPLLSGNVIIKYQNDSDELENISVPIAAAITAWSRIHMYHYLIKYSNNILAIDTDGIKVDCQLDPSEIDSKELGKMKYEYTFTEAVFPAPKVYGGELEKPYKQYEKELVKVKGLKNPIPYYGLKQILNKDKYLPIPQEKWRRELSKSTILINEENYTLGLGETKRQFIYNSWGDFVDSIPLYLKDGKIVKRNFPTVFYLPKPPIVNYLPKPKPELYIDYSLPKPIIMDYYLQILDMSWIKYKPLY